MRFNYISKKDINFLMWIIWRERNTRTFEGIERSIYELKLLFFFRLCVIGKMLRVSSLSFLYLICLIFVLALLLNFLSLLLAHCLCVFPLYFLTSFSNKVY